MRRFEAAAKYSSLQETIDAPSTEVLRFVCDENVASMSGAGILTVVIELVELEVWSATESAEVALSKASCGMDEISILLDFLCKF